ncbi:hypothetical protein D7X30_33605 [Corallococcus sp. AB011P]|uniref:hypothetical protein n=1 Tax=unclassified Corallococcus TaxID=2685029 RepID=UPI000EA2EC03|nr:MULTISPECIES: hypothetical protein [unclassified Corallococcus]RKG52544.1 hypothetical protein D7X30_33605 [Corallococcus sp. AB011P]RKH91274.1 hypothetical protein D7Y21_03615 [Corallococcus sp. AB045]
MAASDGIDPALDALTTEGPLPGVEGALRALLATQKARRFRHRLTAGVRSLAPLGGIILCIGIAGTAEGPLSVVAGVLGIGLAAALFVRSLLFTRFHAAGHPGDDPNRRPELVVRVLQRLKADLAPDTSVRLRLRPDPRPEGPGSSLFMVKYRKSAPPDVLDPWLLLETRLADGAHLRLSAVERRRIKVSDHGPDGPRRRTKSKQSDTLFLEARLRVKAKRHPGLAALSLDRARAAVLLPPGAKLQRLRITGEHLRLRIQLEEAWRPFVPKDTGDEKSSAPDASRAVTMMLLSLYQMLHLARTPPAPKAARQPPREKPPHPRARSRRRRSG